ncbi:FMN-binding negative transcriptional regulator [Ferruginibacter sp.]|jgi:transcriptional regulator
MYKLGHFTEADEQKVIAFMQENSFAMITGISEKYPVATQIPLEVEVKEGNIFLHGHIMRNTDHHKAFEKNENVLVVFTGPHCYVSASWYTNPQTASTWNYMTVHAKGKIIFTDEEGTCNVIKALTNKYEGLETAAAFNKMPKEYILPMLKAIIGFTIEVESLENTFKLSQNRDEASKKNIIEQLKKRGDYNSAAIANEMEKLNDQ